ncbi:hypothetical protein DB346_05235 [Verrucomicrobia bacterium LW23]|nr:hypothetical protein DB346_05235 [Verrucomicrobia bacterium LW23]
MANRQIGHTKTILIACADAREGYFLHKFLEKEHPAWACEKAETLAELRRKMAQMVAGLIVCDFTLPDGNMMSTIMENLEDGMNVQRFIILGPPHVKESLKWLLACSRRFTFLAQPVDLEEFTQHVESVWAVTPDAILSGITLPAFLQVLGVEQKTCLLEVATTTGDGQISLIKGRIAYAVYGGFIGEEAVFELCRSIVPQMRVFISRLPQTADIDVAVMDILLRYYQTLDESGNPL